MHDSSLCVAGKIFSSQIAVSDSTLNLTQSRDKWRKESFILLVKLNELAEHLIKAHSVSPLSCILNTWKITNFGSRKVFVFEHVCVSEC